MIRNAVTFTLSSPVSAFGVFGGDLETGGPNASPQGFLCVEFTNGDTERVFYTLDSTLFADASFSGTGNNLSETYGNETGRFIGIADDIRLIDSVTFVVGDDDDGDDGDTERLSLIAPIVLTEVSGGACSNHVPTNIPEPVVIIFLGHFAFSPLIRNRR